MFACSSLVLRWDTRVVLHSLTVSRTAGRGGSGKGASLSWLRYQKDGSFGAGVRAELPDVSQRSAGFGTCPADGRLCSQLCSVSWADAVFFPRTWHSVAVS